MPSPKTYVWVNAENPYELDYILGLADAIYKKYKDDTVAVYLKEALYNINSGRVIEYCVTASEIMKQRRELLSTEYVMKAMENRMTWFDHGFVNLLTNEKYKEKYSKYGDFTRIIGTISVFPKVYEQTVERIYFNDTLDKIRSLSEYIHTHKERVNLKLKLISRRFSRDRNCWIVNALCDNKNLVTYFDSKANITSVKIGDEFKIRATVINHTFSDFTRCKETRLSRIVYS